MTSSVIVTLVQCWLGAVALGFAFLGWRRRRDDDIPKCPRCRYDMTGAAGGLCPECGRVTTSARVLFRHRRRRRARYWLAALLLGLVAVFGARIDDARRKGWVRLIPSAVLVHIAPPIKWDGYHPVGSVSRLSTEAYLRLFDERLSLAEARVWVRRNYRGVNLAALVSAPRAWPTGLPVPIRCRPVTGLRDRLDVRAGWRDEPISVTTVIYGKGADYSELSEELLPPFAEAGVTHVVIAEFFVPTASGPVRLGSVELPVLGVASAESALTPVDSPEFSERMRSELRFNCESRFAPPDGPPVLQVWFPNHDPPGSLGVVIEFCRDGQPIGQAAAVCRGRGNFWDHGDLSSFAQRLSWPTGVPRPHEMWSEAQRWTVRVRGDAATAMRDFKAERYWRGVVEIPISSLNEDGESPPAVDR